jgi:hypothetical protein
MKSRMFLSTLPVLLAMIVFASNEKAQAFDLGISVGDHHHYRGSVVQYRTADPAYTTWYPDSSTTYVYTPSDSTYYDNGPGYVTPYVYTTESSNYGDWYGTGRSGHGGNYGRSHERDLHSGGAREGDHRGSGGSGFKR